MKKENDNKKNGRFTGPDPDRAKLLGAMPVSEKQIVLAGISTTYLEGGEGPPIILLHGPGESAVWWMRVIPELVKYYRVIAPDLPGHGGSGLSEDKLTNDRILAWLGSLIKKTCEQAPVLIGHVLGGAIATRFAIKAPEKLSQLILVDSLGLSSFRPAPMFAFELIRFMMGPDEKSYLRFLPQCMYDVKELRRQMGACWEPFLAYNLACARNPEGKVAMKALMGKMGVPKIPKKELESIQIPVTLIWGRHDRANRLATAYKASKSLGWPLHIIEECRDDPKLEKPGAFLKAVSSALKIKLEISE